MPLFDELPPRPGAAPDWPALESMFEWLRALDGCPQDPIFHAEGDVLIHTRRVMDALLGAEGWSDLPSSARRALFWAVLLHDVAKPETTRKDENGRITAQGHARRGAIRARAILWRLGAPVGERERICHLVAHHQAPFSLIERADAARQAAAISWRTRCDLLARLAEADARGRTCPDLGRLLDNIALFGELCREQNCFEAPRRFASDHTRFLYFRGADRPPDIEAYDDTRGLATLMSGLPASGKDHWLAREAGEAAIVSLDALRAQLGVSPSGPQGRVIAAAREQAKTALRRGAPMVWNATNLSREIRRGLLNIFADYGARTRIVVCEADEADLRRRNAARRDAVPQKAIERMLTRWEAPDRIEAHEMVIVDGPSDRSP